MSTHVAAGVAQTKKPQLVEGADLADGWLEDALAALTASCDPGRPDRLESARRSIAFAALALEARLNRVLACADPAEHDALAHLSPAERFRLAPRLLAHLEAAAEDAALCDLVVEVLRARDELVDGDGVWHAVHGPARFSPARARTIVEESARICCFISTLAESIPAVTAKHVWHTAAALAGPADELSAERPPALPRWDWDWDDDAFPPRLIGS